IAKIPNHPTAITVAVVATGTAIGLTAGLLCMLIMLMSGGSWAIGDLSSVGPPVLVSSGLFAAHIGIGSAIGYALAPLPHGAFYYRRTVVEENDKSHGVWEYWSSHARRAVSVSASAKHCS